MEFESELGKYLFPFIAIGLGVLIVVLASNFKKKRPRS
jgi:hypothetical protein